MREKEFGYHDSGLPGPEEVTDEERRLAERRRTPGKKSKRQEYVPTKDIPSPAPDPLEQLIAHEEDGEDEDSEEIYGVNPEFSEIEKPRLDPHLTAGDLAENIVKFHDDTGGETEPDDSGTAVAGEVVSKSSKFDGNGSGHKSRRNFGRMPISKNIARESIRRKE